MTNKLIDLLEKTIDDEMILNSFIRKNLCFLKKEDENIYLGVSDQKTIDFINQTCMNKVVQATQKVFKNNKLKVFIEIKDDFVKLENAKTTSSINKNNNLEPIENNLNTNFNFANFFQTSFNKEVFNASKKIIESYGSYNPFLIVGNSGLGKTHLLYAIGNEFQKKEKKVFFIKPNLFTNEYVSNLTKDINILRDKYLKYDVLIIDDIQIFGNRIKTLNFLFEIYNDFIENNKQIVLSSDTTISMLGGFSDRFLTRFNRGLTLTIQQPQYDDLKEILTKKLLQVGFDLQKWEDEAIDFLVRNSDFNIRSLEGKVTQVKFFFDDKKNEYFSYLKIKNIFTNSEINKLEINITRITTVISKYYDINKQLLIGKKRKNNIVIARDMCIYFFRNILGLSFVEIGKYLSNRSHTTIMASYKKISNQKKLNTTVRDAIRVLEGKIYKLD